MYAWLLELLRAVARDHKRLVRASRDAQARIVALGERFDPRPRLGINYGVARRGQGGALLFDYPAYAEKGDEIEILSFDQESLGARRYPGREPVTYRAPHRRTFVPTASVAVPAAYLAPAELAERLRGHGVAFEALEEATELDVESYRILAIEKTFSPDVAGQVPPLGGAEVPLHAEPPPQRFETVLTVRPERRRTELPAGTLVVPTAQRAGVLAAYLLEPHADDGFARWEMLDAHLQVGGYFPVHRQIAGAPPRGRVRPE